MEQNSNIFSRTLQMIKENKHIKDEGLFNSIPFGLPSLDKHIPGIMKGCQYIITANSGIGKTQLAKYLFVNQPYKFVKENPDLGIKLKILYFALEESKEEFMLTLISNRLKEEYGISIGVMELRSMGGYTLRDEILTKVEECTEYFAELEKSIDVVDSISNPYGIYKYFYTYATENGKHHYKTQTFTHRDEEGKTYETQEQVYDYYEPNDPNEFVIGVVDHMSLLSTEKTGEATTVHGAMTKMSAEYGRKTITKRFKYCLTLIQQQAADKEKQQYTFSGHSVEAKLEPSLDGLGDNKLTQRDAHVVLGLFAPERYGIETHMKYDIKVLQDFYRCLTILKNRIGTPNLKLPLLFNGQTNTFAELPKAGTPELEKLYTLIKNYREIDKK